MNKETIATQIEEWFCDADCGDGGFAIAELYALLYSESKRNLRYWTDTYRNTENQLKEKLFEVTGLRGFSDIDSKTMNCI